MNRKPKFKNNFHPSVPHKALYQNFPKCFVLPSNMTTRDKNRTLYTTSDLLVQFQNDYTQSFSLIKAMILFVSDIALCQSCSSKSILLNKSSIIINVMFLHGSFVSNHDIVETDHTKKGISLHMCGSQVLTFYFSSPEPNAHR